MALNDDWVQDLLTYKKTLEARTLDFNGKDVYGGPLFSDSGGVGRAWIDGALVVYDLDDPPIWLEAVQAVIDDDGNSPGEIISWEPYRTPDKVLEHD